MKKAIVIGASSGIGKKLAEVLARNGYLVGITGRRSYLLSELEKTNPEVFIPESFDITDLKNTVENLKMLVQKTGGCDLLVLSSGTGDLNPTLKFDLEKETIDVNVAGFTNIADWIFSYFEHQGYGHLLVITSVGGLRGSPDAPAYNASKAYQINYLEGLQKKATLLHLPITITDIRPGLVDTAMAKGDGLFWVMPVEKAALQIFSAIKRKKRVAYVTRRWGTVALVLRLLPRWMYNRI
jgi:short-subunit dehydrogenase